MARPLTERERALALRAFASRFVNGPGCWLWTGARHGDYGYMIVGSRSDGSRRQVPAHVLSWELHNGHSPLKVLHVCDVPLCVRPDHLFVGTQADNVRDMMAKGRNRVPTGERHWNKRLSANDVAAIRRRYADGEASQSALAREYGVKQPAIWKIVNGVSWKSLPVPIDLRTGMQ